MKDIFITNLLINQIRHLNGIDIFLSDKNRKHLILTGKNGSGKTSVLEVLKDYLQSFYDVDFNKNKRALFNHTSMDDDIKKIEKEIDELENELLSNDGYKYNKEKVEQATKCRNEIEEKIKQKKITKKSEVEIELQKCKEINSDIRKGLPTEIVKKIDYKVTLLSKQIDLLLYSHCGYSENIDKFRANLIAPFNEDPTEIIHTGKFVVAYFNANRETQFEIPKGISKINKKEKYDIKEKAGKDFLQFLVNLKADRSFARDDNDKKTVKKIDEWFKMFQKLLIDIFEDEKIVLKFDKSTYNFNIIQENKNAIDFTELSDGYSAIFNMISELMMRMEKYKSKIYDLQGIVLIDEIETHLHIDLQKKIIPFLTKVFPNIQFIVSTHSPFVLSSEENTIIYDLEKNIMVEDMSGYSFDSIIESYYNSDKYSIIVKQKIAEFEQLYNKENLTEEEEEKLIDLKLYFKDLPKFLSPELSVKLSQIQLSKISAK